MMPLDRRNDAAFNMLSFPSKLYALLEDADAQGFADIISWQPGGKSFKVHQTSVFSKTIMKSYFCQTKFKSFQRQLNIYGWKKVQLGPNKGGYMHKDFTRGQPELCDRIVRRKGSAAHGTTTSKIPSSKPQVSTTSSSAAELLMPSTMQQPQLQLNESEVDALYDFFHPKKESSLAADAGFTLSSLFALDDEDEVMEPPLRPIASAPIQEAHFLEGTDLNDFITLLAEDNEALRQNQPQQQQQQQQHDDSYLDDLLFDFSGENATPSAMPSVPVQDNAEQDVTGESSDLSFPFKLHLMLENAERDNYAHAVSWVQEGSAFKVHDHHAFTEEVMSNFFDQSKYESFRRQLNLYQFKRVARGIDRGVISHPCFRRGNRDLCQNISRKKHQQLAQT